MVSIMEWNDAITSPPPMAKRVLVLTYEGHWLPGRQAYHLMNGKHWIDDQSLPIKGVVKWTEVVAPDETT